MTDLSTLQQIQELWAKLDQDDREKHLEWTLHHCAWCGRPGTWEGGAAVGNWCDACCDEQGERWNAK